MHEIEAEDLQTKVDALERERAHLLDELEKAYLQMEEHLVASSREQEITYQELRERNRELQERLEELERAHEQLQETQRMLVRSERLAAMGEMAAAIVHEVKNPLTVIIGQVHLLMSRDTPPKKESLERVLRASEHLKGLVENALGFARNHRREPCDVDLNGLLTQVKEFVTPIIRGVRLHLEPATDLPPVRTDPAQIEQILVNLILNALDALQRKGHIYLLTGVGSINEAVEEAVRAGRRYAMATSMQEEVRQRAFVYAEVRDDGPGIRESHLAQLFEAFFTTKEEGEGTGLGLSIARSIVGEWGGNILVSSTEGQGARFRVFLPPDTAGQGATPASM